MALEIRPLLSIVIPAYNEENRIVPTLENTLAYLSGRSYKSEIIVVSDGSRDSTARVARQFRSTGKIQLKILEYYPNRGKGHAVRYGMLRTQGRLAMFMDADYAVPMVYCEQGLALLNKGNDIAIASRSVSGAKIQAHQNLARQLSARIYTLIQNYYLGIDYPDTQCGFKFFTHDAALSLFTEQKLNSVIFDPEILWLAQRHGYRISQFPVQWRHVPDSRIQYDSIRKSLFVFRELFKIKKLHAQ